jgi:hypothetical protein
MAAALLNTLPMPSTNGVDWVYRQLKDILGVAAEQQAKSSLQQWVEDSVSSPGRSKASWQRTASELPVAGTVSSPTRAPTRLQPGHPSGHPEPQACYKAHQGGGACSEHRVHNPCCGGCDDRERHSVNPERTGPKALGSNVGDTCFPKHFQVPNNVVMYDGKTNPNVWLEDYRLVCRVGGADHELFIIQFLPHLLSRHDQGLAQSHAQKLDRLLGGSQGDLHWQLSRHIRAAGQSLGFEVLPAEAR